MTTITVWEHIESKQVLLHALSDDPADGTTEEQIDYLKTLNVFAGYACVAAGFSGLVPTSDPGLWRWNGSEVISLDAPIAAQPTPEQIRLVLAEIGLTQQQLDNLFTAAAAL